ncbi:putative protein kinase RLK-Pelle-LRR-I-1 family [Helianthus annuus]|uniref:non-specific serine/threonine protein kinase n=1 Tax=Helianthus annuus TaxID=4232 RepID=A0A9K3HT69_HELAN|nr:putative protein kinase RLK-Pelle-LRR-I-1 family [Helianthus annuus]
MSSFDSKFDYLKLPLIDIQTATNHFADENIVRRDEFGNEYKGQLLLSSGQLIDILARRLDLRSFHGTKEFQTEIMMLATLKHQNLVSIVGFCDEDKEKIIINKYEAKGSLDQYLSDPIKLPWTQRLQICLGIARALSYIHYDQGRTFSVIHRDIKSSKIVLDDKWEAKLSGFELSMMQPAARRQGLVLEEPCGTPGYVDPACAASRTVNHKSDVYSLGVVLFEVLTGRKVNSDDGDWSLFAKTAKSHYENGNLNDVIHPDLHKQMDQGSLKKFSEAAYCCLKDQRSQRPNIDQLVFALDQALKLQMAHEASLALKEHSTLSTSSSDYWKGKNLEHLRIGFDAITSATENFAETYFIGKGAYGLVYKAELEHFDPCATKGNRESEMPRRRSTVAIKYIIDREDAQGEQGFIAEIETLSSCKHANIVSLLGFCHEHPHMILIYEFVSNGSLDDYLGNEGKMTNLTWVQRIKICIDIARGLDYIHTTMDDKQKIIHRDIKSANILLSKNWEAKIADFGLSRFHPIHQTKSTIITNNVVGTRVYWDPEYERTGNLKKESDVYSFGVVLFEVLTGKLAYDSVYTNENEKGLAPIVQQHIKKGTITEMVDPNLKEENTFTLSKGPNQDSLNTFILIGHRCLAEKQAERPTMKVVIEELVKALNFQETYKDNLRISLEDILNATQGFSDKNLIGKVGFGKVYRGEIIRANGPTPIAVKRLDRQFGRHRERVFLTEVEVLFEYKHENIIGLVGYCDENDEKILVYEYASNGILDRHLTDASITWTKRLKIGIDIATGLDFLHGGGYPVIHRDVKSDHIVLNDDWKAKIKGFGFSVITPLDNEIDFVVDNVVGTTGYCDPLYIKRGLLTRESDVYSLGVVLFEMMCGRLAFIKNHEDEHRTLVRGKDTVKSAQSVKSLVFEGIKDKIVPKSLTTFQRIAYQCLHDEREQRPTARELALQLKKALEFQEDIEIWEVRLPRDYKEIIQKSRTPELYSNVSKKDIYFMFSKGILLQDAKVCLSIGTNGERSEMVSAATFSYENNRLHKRRSIQKSRFQRVVKMMDISDLNIQIKIRTQFLSPKVIYGAHLVFKFCEPRKLSKKLMYVNLKYQMGSETLHAYFATRGDDEWMMIELCRFIPHKKDVYFEVLLGSLSRYYCGSGAIYVEGIHFRAIDDSTFKPEVYENLKGVQRVLKSNSDSVQQVSVDYDEITQLEDGVKILPQSNVNGKKWHTLPAKMVLYESSDVKCYNWKALDESESRFQEVAELLSHQVFRIKCKIETQKLSADTDYACYLVFKLSQKCHGLQCPVKVRDVLLRKNKEYKFLYFRSPRAVNLHNIKRVPKLREDGLMEVIVWEFNSGNNDHVPMSLKLRCYEGTMSGLIVHGIEFRPL